MVWGPGYSGAPPPNPPTGDDPFTAAERDTKAMVSAGWWAAAPAQQRQHAIGGRVLVLPDGTWWSFGAWARWYRWHPSDGQWYLCPPPRGAATRSLARPAQGAQVPPLPPHVIPAGPDFSIARPAALPFVGQGFGPELTERIRATVNAAAALPVADYPHWWTSFSSTTPSTVAVAWGVLLWCADTPVFDSRLDAQMLDLWAPYRTKPLPAVDGVRWLTPPPLEALVGLYAERLRSSRVDAAVVVLRTMWSVAGALREDRRFRARADALLGILGGTLSNPTVDYGALPYGDQSLVQQWLIRCPPQSAPALRHESSPGDDFRHAFYDSAQALAEIAGDPADPSFLEPRLVAAGLLAADLAVVRDDVAGKVLPWLDPEIKYTVQAVLAQSGHPLRRLWPVDARLPDRLRTGLAAGGGTATAEKLLATSFGLDLAWCRLAGIPARPRGFPVPTAFLAEVIGTRRATAVAADSAMTPPAAAPSAPAEQPWPAYPGSAGAPAGPGSAGPAGGHGQPGWPSPPAGSPYQTPGQPPGAPQAWGGPAGPGAQAAFGVPAANPAAPGAVPPGSAPPGGPFQQPGRLHQQPGEPFVQTPAHEPVSPDPHPADRPPESASPAEPGHLGMGGFGDPGAANPAAGGPGAASGASADGAGQQPLFGAAGPGAGVISTPGGAADDDAEVDWAPPYTALGYLPAGGRGGAQPDSSAPQDPTAPPEPAAWSGAAAGSGAVGPPTRPADDARHAAAPPAGQAMPGHSAWPAAQPASPQPPGRRDEPAAKWRSPYEDDDADRPDAGPPAPPDQGAHTPYPGRDDAASGAPAAAPHPGWDDPTATRIDSGDRGGPEAAAGPAQASAPPSTRVFSADAEAGPGEPAPAEQGPGAGGPARGEPVPPSPGAGSGTRVMSETMVGGFDFLEQAPVPDRPVSEIAPPPAEPSREVSERFGIKFVSGRQEVGELLDLVGDRVAAATAAPVSVETRIDGDPASAGMPSVLLVGGPHTGQRRLARMIALTLADAGVGDGSLQAAQAEDVRGAGGDRLYEVLRPAGPAQLFEGLDAAVLDADDPAAMVSAVRRARLGPAIRSVLVATCDVRTYERLVKEHTRLIEVFRVYRLPDLAEPENRMTLLHLLADERRATLADTALRVAEADLERLRGPGDLVNARLVEAYLDQGCQRAMNRTGATGDRMVLTADDLTGIAESIEPALREPGDIDRYLVELDGLMGLHEVKEAVRELVASARVAADRARHGVQSRTPRNLVFLGPSGVGKTTVAGLIGGIYGALGLLGSGHVVECSPEHLTGRDSADTAGRVASMADQAAGGVLLVQRAHRLDRVPGLIDLLLRRLDLHGADLLMVLAGPPAELERLLAADPRLREEFPTVVEFTELSAREMVQLFQRYAERDLYMLDEELRVELLDRFARRRDDPDFGHAREVRRVFDEAVARQAARLAGERVDAASIARLTVRDLPESALEQMLGDFEEH